MKRSFVCVTNIPSPYRLDEFECLSRELDARGICFKAIFMAETERGRDWQFHSKEWSFKHEVVPGMAFHLQDDTPFLLNPGILLDLIRKPPDWLLLGGSWYLPTVVAASFIAKIRHRRTSVLFWSESWADSHHHISGRIGLAIRKRLLGLYDGFVVPGRLAEDYVRSFSGRNARCIKLANFVDERLYHDHVMKLRNNRHPLRDKYHLKKENLVFLWPARLVPVKGILQFLEAAKSVSATEFTILIAGEGPQRSEIENWLVRAKEHRVRLLGHQDIDRLLELYAISDVLILPSISEPYGFVAVEGIWAGLPLLLSNKVGAWPEVLKPGENGWLLNPENTIQVREVFEDILACNPEQLRKMGKNSLAIAAKNFTSVSCIRRFVEDLCEQFPQ